jgi:hypothetical protein
MKRFLLLLLLPLPLFSQVVTIDNGTMPTERGKINANFTYLSSNRENLLTFSTGLLRTTNAITCITASGSALGCLSSTDWTTFNGKQASLGFTAVANTVTVNGHALSSNVTVTTTDLSLNNVTNDAQTKASIFPNTAPAAGQIGVGNAGGTAYAPVSLTQDCTITATGVVTCLKTNNVSFGTAATVNTGTSGATIPLLNGTNTWSGAHTFSSTINKITLTPPTTAWTITPAADNQTTTLPAGTLVANTRQVAGHALSADVTVSASDVGLGSVTNDAQTKAAIHPNTLPTAGQIAVGNAGGTAYAPVSLTQDCTITSAGVVTCLKTNNVSFGTAATSNTGTSGATLGLLNGALTFAGANAYGTPASITLTNGTGLPVSTGITGFGTGVATFLATPTGANFNAMVTSGVQIPQNSKSAAYTTVLTDCMGSVYHPGADTTARTWTIDSNANVAAPIGCTITFVNDTSAGVLTIAITSDTLVLAGAGTTGSRALAASGIATATKITSTRWMINGSGLT